MVLLLLAGASARCVRGDALLALLFLLWMDSGASAPDNCPADEAGRLGEAALALISFFASVTFTAAACAAIAESSLTLEAVRSCWEASESSAEFVTLVRGCCPKLPVAVSVGMAAALRKAVEVIY